MLVITRLRAPASDPAAAELRAGLQRSLEILGACPGFLGGEAGRNIDEPDLWVLSTRWENVGSYRRALGSYESKMFVQPLMVHALDEPSAYERADGDTDLNEPIARSLG